MRTGEMVSETGNMRIKETDAQSITAVKLVHSSGRKSEKSGIDARAGRKE
jgi:hypothetical protein